MQRCIHMTNRYLKFVKSTMEIKGVRSLEGLFIRNDVPLSRSTFTVEKGPPVLNIYTSPFKKKYIIVSFH